VLIQRNRVARGICCVAAGVCALAFARIDASAIAADETEPDAAVVTDGADVVDSFDVAVDQGAAEQPEIEAASEDAESESEHTVAIDSGERNEDAHAGEHAVGDADHQDGVHHQDGAHHDPHDLSQANATPKLEDPSEWRYDMALCTFTVFLVLLVILRAFAWRPIMAGLERRESAIATRIEEAERDAAEAATQLQAYRDKLKAAAQEAQEIVSQARRDAEAVAEKVRSAAAEDAVRERQRALADIESAKKVALHEIAEKGADMAVGLAGRIVRRELNSQDHAELIRETLGQFPSKN
jgi:F-type H+-transporting ATPase subunit b